MKYLFLLGCPRSGTTMLQQALNRHSQIVLPPETKYFYWFYGQPRRVQCKHLERLKSDLRIELPPPADWNRRTPQGARAYFEGIARTYIERVDRNDVAYFGDKTPEHTSQLDRIRDVFPEAKFLFLYRDGRDVALSLTRVPWIRCTVYGGFAIWRYYYRMLRAAMVDSALDILYMKYEDLVRAPEHHLERIAHFLGLEYEPAMAHGRGNPESIPDRERPWKGRALQPITAERIEVWRHELTGAQIQDLEWLGRKELTALDYSLSTSGCRPASWLLRGRMALEMMRCAWQLPWPVLWNEVRRPLRSVALRREARRGQHLRAPVAEATQQREDLPCVLNATDGFRASP